MTIEDFIPTEILKPFIKAYRIIESQDELENRVLPNTSLTIAFRFKGDNSYNIDNAIVELPKFTFSGLRKTARLINYSSNTSTLIVLFKECGVSAFFNEPYYEIFENSISLDSIIHPNEQLELEDKLSDTKNNIQRVALIEQFLIKRLNIHQPDKLVFEAIKRMHGTHGFLKIKELADTLCISHDAFEKRFRKLVGATPKQFASIIRMACIVKTTPTDRFFDIAYDKGYYDQSHFNRDFKNFTGLTPTQFYNSTSFW